MQGSGNSGYCSMSSHWWGGACAHCAGTCSPWGICQAACGNRGPQKSWLVAEALTLVPAWGWRCRIVVGDAGQEQEGTQAKGRVGGSWPWSTPSTAVVWG